MDAQALGRYLRETREAKEITLDEAERALRIRQRILEAFEAGEFTLPEIAAIQVRGFMRNYARYLGLDDDRVVAYYEEALLESASPKRLSGRAPGGREPGKKRKDKRDSQPIAPVAPRAVTDTPPSLPAVQVPVQTEKRRRGASPITILLRLLVAAAALAVIAYVVVQMVQTSNPDPTVTEDAGIFGQLPPTPTSTTPPTIEMVSILPTESGNLQPGFNGQGVLVTINLDERSWLHITADGTDQYIGIAPPGTSLEYPAGSNVTVVASNAQALNVVFNGQQQPIFGARGQLVTVVFSPNGVDISSGPGYEPTPINSPTPLPLPTDPAGALVAQLTPTETPGPSPTPTETPTETPIPSDTPIPTDTPIPSDTPTITPVPTDTPIPSNTPTLTLTPTFTLTPTLTPVPTDTPIPSDTPIPTATSILPPRGIPPNATPTKVGK
jgi:hypothetical protein